MNNHEGSLRVYAWAVPTSIISILALAISLNALQPTQPTTVGAPAAAQTVEVSLSEMRIDPATVEVVSGAPVTLRVSNVGGTIHNLAVEGHGATEILDAGASQTLDLGVLAPGTYRLSCEVPGHEELGMTAALLVGEASRTDAAHGGMSAEEMDRSYMVGVEAFPAPTEGRGGQPLDPVMDGTTKVFELTAAHTRWEVEPGDVREAMAYNRQVPGPEIRVGLGDRVRVILHNELEESTSIHFHGLNVPNDQDGVPGLTQPLVKPGESYTYEFDVPNAGSHMYHSHMNGAEQIPMGLLGAFIVDGPDEPEVDVDQTIVLNDGPLGYTINGKGFPATEPIVASPGQTVRLRYMNEGLQGHPMHLHGMEQLVFAKDGWPLPQPYRADTVWVGPGERYDVLVEAREGLWAFHCHILSHAEGPQGMFGMVTVMVVQ